MHFLRYDRQKQQAVNIYSRFRSKRRNNGLSLLVGGAHAGWLRLVRVVAGHFLWLRFLVAMHRAHCTATTTAL